MDNDDIHHGMDAKTHRASNSFTTSVGGVTAPVFSRLIWGPVINNPGSSERAFYSKEHSHEPSEHRDPLTAPNRCLHKQPSWMTMR